VRLWRSVGGEDGACVWESLEGGGKGEDMAGSWKGRCCVAGARGVLMHCSVGGV